ncbi:MAG: hypothetical protein ABIQ51_13615 [Mesorhizobium sp.]
MSLGPNCRPKANIRRVFGRNTSLRHVFDWQVTPPSALIDYFQKDFVGFFEREDLFVHEAGVVGNRRYGTLHYHEFPAGFTEAALVSSYAAARARHDRWCTATRRALDNRRPTLFVLGQPLPESELQTIVKLIAARCSFKDFAVLDGPEGDDDTGDLWEGNPTLWSKHLSPFKIEMPFSALVSYQIYRLRKHIG